MDLIKSESEESTSFVENLCSTSYFHEYVSLTLTQERQFLNNELTYEMLNHYLPKVLTFLKISENINDFNYDFDSDPQKCVNADSH